ncbi:MAG: EscU/YscU/HrcU family type III secretion system export apparatus switch protein [Chlamydiae bacterium RIFCSPHIGHO2_12_FULL_49_11]|nr:MAG: EscU/YscU/HrcU family type III secretion system export apparatus switch protein [Chlamydiae bacterium RIFCSPHIGHO2_12_FULL_49_11]
MAEKTEKATPKKLRDARKKGQVAKSQDFPAAFTFIVAIFGALIAAGYFYDNLAEYMKAMFLQVRNLSDFENRAGGYIIAGIQIIFSTSFPLMLSVSLIGLLVSFLIVGPMFSMEVMKPDVKRLNPVTNIRNMFKLRTFVELLKSIFKITGALLLIYSVIYDSISQIIETSMIPVLASVYVFSDFLKNVVLRVGIFFIIVAVLDLAFQRRNFAKEMRMEKFEVKQEYKDTEGDPHIKGRRRQTAQEIAYSDGPSTAGKARAIVTNPTHIAVALEYDEEKDPAPKILTMGLGLVAQEILRVAEKNDVPIMRNVDLARTLYYKGSIGDYVPEETYNAIAAVLKWLAKLEQEKRLGERTDLSELFK